MWYIFYTPGLMFALVKDILIHFCTWRINSYLIWHSQGFLYIASESSEKEMASEEPTNSWGLFSVDYCLNCANTKHLECDSGVMGEKVLPKEHFHLVSFEQYFYHVLFQLSKGIWNNVFLLIFYLLSPILPLLVVPG